MARHRATFAFTYLGLELQIYFKKCLLYDKFKSDYFILSGEFSGYQPLVIPSQFITYIDMLSNGFVITETNTDVRAEHKYYFHISHVLLNI